MLIDKPVLDCTGSGVASAYSILHRIRGESPSPHPLPAKSGERERAGARLEICACLSALAGRGWGEGLSPRVRCQLKNLPLDCTGSGVASAYSILHRIRGERPLTPTLSPRRAGRGSVPLRDARYVHPLARRR